MIDQQLRGKPANVAHDVDEAFKAFDNTLLLDPRERAAAERLHNEITDLLRSAELITAAFLQGSFARKTMISPLRDIDKVVVLSPAMASLRHSPRGPDLAMDAIERIICAHWPSARFERSKHALNLDFGATNFSFDIVPAFESDTDDDDVLIADRSSGGWERSNTRTLIRAVQERNDVCAGKFIHQARMGKSFARVALGDSFPGLHTEALAYAAVDRPLDHASAMARTLRVGAELLRTGYTDPTGVDPLSRHLQPAVRQQTQVLFAVAAARAVEAISLANAGDQTEAMRVWHEIFGDPFPNPHGQTVDEAFRRAGIGGAITSAGTASLSSIGRQPSRPTRSWRR
jgi:hypothetical protein